MIFQRFIVGPTDGAGLFGKYKAVSHLWEHGDGTSMFRVECDDPGFDALSADATLTVLPSLNAPAAALGAKGAAFLAKQGITPGASDTVLNVLRKMRDARGLTMRIDQAW